jgi:N-acetylglutamate synthase-like GNAT family acetyltransferase/DNA-binding MarR family transcriptional regulator
MTKKDLTSELRNAARQLIRDLGLLKLNSVPSNRTTQEWHALIEIQNQPNITIAKLGEILLLSKSRISRVVGSLIKEDLIKSTDGLDRREKLLQLTSKGSTEIRRIDDFTNKKVKGALTFLTLDEQRQIIEAMQLYSMALQKNRKLQEGIKIHTLSTSRVLRLQIIELIENIQKNEFSLPISPDLNSGILKAEGEYYYNNSYNFWYAVDDNGKIVGSIGLKKINDTCAELKKFFVAADYRGRGISQKLMQVLIKTAVKHQFKYLYLGTISKLKAANNFYEKYGFSKIRANQLPPHFDKCFLDNVFFKVKCNDLQSTLLNQIRE